MAIFQLDDEVVTPETLTNTIYQLYISLWSGALLITTLNIQPNY